MGTHLRKALATSALRAAFKRVQANHGQPGVDGETVEAFAARLPAALGAMQANVLGGRYQPQALKRLWLPRPGKAPRPLAVPTVADRVLQTAVARSLQPLLEAEFENASFAYRQGRSVRMAVERIRLLQRQGFNWVVEADIERFFDCIVHERLLRALAELVPDAELLALVGQWLTAPVQAGSTLTPVRVGVPQGSPISPGLANLYLDVLDEALLDGDYALVRYADDFVVLTRSQQRAEQAVTVTEAVLQDLELKLNPLKTRVVNFEQGFEFLGWNFVRSLAVPARSAGERAGVEPARLLSSNPEDDKLPSDDSTNPPMPQNSPGPQAAAMDESPVYSTPLQGAGTLAGALLEAFDEQPNWQPSPPAAQGEPAAAGTEPPPNAPPPVQVLLAPNPATKAPQATDLDADSDLPALPPPSLQRTLYILDANASLHTENRRLQVQREGEVLLDLPAVNVDLVVLIGRPFATTAALVCCMQHDIPVAYLSAQGKFRGRMEPPCSQAVTLQAAQFAAQQDAQLGLAIARNVVAGKLGNALLTLRRYGRHRSGVASGGDKPAHNAIKLHLDFLRRLKTAPDMNTLRGFEGAAAAAYFGTWRAWLGDTWAFGSRVARQGADPINALLDLGYTLLRQAVAGLIQARGLNPWLGHLHVHGAGHQALASDLMEEFRPLVVDAVVLKACLGNELTPEDFVARQGAYTLKPEAARRFIRMLEERLQAERQHPHSGELLDTRRLIDSQVRSLAAAYRSRDASLFKPCVLR